MASFKDLNGKEWQVVFDAPKIRAVRTALSIDPVSSEGYERLYDDDALLPSVLAIVCKEQLGNVTADAFESAVTGDAIDRAREAYKAAVMDFSPSRKREVMRAVAAKVEKAREVVIEESLAKINSPEFEAQLIEATRNRANEAIEEALTQLRSATNSRTS